MAGYGWCYDSPVRCSGKAQPGVRVFRDTMDDLLPELGDYGIYNCRSSRTGSTLSLHGEGRAWDCAIPYGSTSLGDVMATWCVRAAQDLGIQRVIWGFGAGKAPKEWDSRQGERYWEAYSGPAHDDHLHIEFCWKAALNLTAEQVTAAYFKYWPGAEEDELSAEDIQYIKNELTVIKNYVREKVDGVYVEATDQIRDMVLAEIKASEARIIAAIQANG